MHAHYKLPFRQAAIQLWSETTRTFVNRDVNAAMNIRRIFLANQRPMMLRHHPDALPRFTKMIKQ